MAVKLRKPDNPDIRKAGCSWRPPRVCQPEAGAVAGRIPACSGDEFGPSADLMRPTHIMEGNPPYSKSTDFNANLIPKTPTQKHPE